MKIYLIKASAGSSYSKYKAETGGPPQNIFAAAAALPVGTEIEMCDETIGMRTNFRSDADIVAVFMSTPDAYRAYEITKKFRKKGRVTILGGLHTCFSQNEAVKNADTIIVGESEGLWEEIISDVENSTLKPLYKRTSQFDLGELKPYPTDIIPVAKYNWIWSVVVSRGCPMHCGFCLVHKFFDKFTLRPIAHIVEELNNLKKLGVEWVELHSDNLTHNKKYALELFHALAPLNMNFYGETTILIAKDQELLAAAQKAGVKILLFGIETPSEDALKEQGKSFVKPDKIKEYVHIIKSYGIEVVGDFLFGFDAHDTTIFDQTITFIREVGIDTAYPHLMIPFPGSECFNKLDAEGRILTKDWSKYDGSHTVFTPSRMSAKELQNGTWKVYKATEIMNKSNTNSPLPSGGSPSTTKTRKTSQNIKWKTLVALILLPPAFYFNLTNFYFAALFLLWSVEGIKNRTTFFLDTITREESPILFWSVSMLWMFLALWSMWYSEPVLNCYYYGF